MKSEWLAINGVIENEDDANPEFPWYPCLFVENGFHTCAGLEIWFATEEECRQFIKDCIFVATLEEEQ
ncbi:hypothetical protein ACIQHZ_31250 [Streptomyces halstedii]|uniref:hypothetical protein n=1 Tax=Streptomyces halstedii TaxID=1944 RepID=UPI00380C5292